MQWHGGMRGPVQTGGVHPVLTGPALPPGCRSPGASHPLGPRIGPRRGEDSRARIDGGLLDRLAADAAHRLVRHHWASGRDEFGFGVSS